MKSMNCSSKWKGVICYKIISWWEVYLWDVMYECVCKKSFGGRTRGRQVYLGGWIFEFDVVCVYDFVVL